MLQLIFVLHNHQPLGNLPDVFRKAYDTAYKPWLDVVRKYPSIKWALHTSGCLWEWLEQEEPGYLEALKKEHAEGRLEFLSGAMWEPIQPIISDESFDKHYDLMRNFLGDKFGVTPHGAWTTERVWEPSLAGRLADQKIQYTLLDDSQLRASLPTADEHKVWGYYRTEYNGKSVNIFPINEQLRYMIPFAKVDEVISHLVKLADELPDGASITYGDDGEKFGLWPDTFDWVYGSGWLDEFLGQIERVNKITTTLPSDYLKMQPLPRKRVYVPTSSYREMGVWSLYPKRSNASEDVHKLIESNYELWKNEPPHSAGFFRNFLAKYPESRYMHERVQEIIDTIIEKAGPDIEASIADDASNAQKALWHALRAQCNCPYWHGVFGGLYLNYLRFAVNREILHAEEYLREYLDSHVRKIGSYHLSDDGEKVRDPESIIILSANPKVVWGIDPVTGQVISAGSVEKKIDVIDVIARRFEAYHATMKDSQDAGSEDKPASIHDISEVAPEGWKENFGYDSCRRGCFGDKFKYPADIEKVLMAGMPPPPCRQPVNFHPSDGPWGVIEFSENEVTLERVDNLFVRRKVFEANTESPDLKLSYYIKFRDDVALNVMIHGLFSMEFNIGLLAGNHSDRHFYLHRSLDQWSLDTKKNLDDLNSIDIIDKWSGVKITVSSEYVYSIKTYPVKTLSRGEAGLELNYQGVSVEFASGLDPANKDWIGMDFKMSIHSL